jgi:hypothetical protein
LRLDNNSVKEAKKPHEGLRRHTTRLHQENGCVLILFYDEGMHLTEHSNARRPKRVSIFERHLTERMRDHIQAFANFTRSMAPATSRAQNRRSRVVQIRMDVIASVSFSKRALRALYALPNSNCSEPPSASSARNLGSEGV